MKNLLMILMMIGAFALTSCAHYGKSGSCCDKKQACCTEKCDSKKACKDQEKCKDKKECKDCAPGKCSSGACDNAKDA